MANFVILRTQKLNSLQSISGSLRHGFREQQTPNADKNKLQENTYFGAENSQQAYKKIKDKLPTERRKNAVLTVEYLVTASPEAMLKMSKQEQVEYFRDSLKWVQDLHGKENVICGGIHRDETTPHMYLYVLPLKDGKLNCKHYLGGSKYRMTELQTDFAQKVGKKHNLARGVEKSKAKHKDIKTFYGELNKESQEIENILIKSTEIVPKTLKKNFLSRTMENNENVVNRLNERLKPIYARALKFEEIKKQNIELKKQNEQLREVIQPAKDFGLPNHMIKEFLTEIVKNIRKQQIENRNKQRELQREQNQNHGTEMEF